MATAQRRIGKIRVEVRETQNRIDLHELYPKLSSVEALRVFMEHHVFAVWDFMSLVKTLQQHLTCTTIPWRPVGDGDVRRFINDIVHCEESDKLPSGRSLSHFELYIEAMRAVGADTGPIEAFIDCLEQEMDVSEALERCGAPEAAQRFVNETFTVIESQSLPAVAAAFTFGREQALPGIFHQLVRRLARVSRRDLSPLVTYLDRHIEVDGGDHGWLAERLLSHSCGDKDEAWASASRAARAALTSRLSLWSGIAELIPEASETSRPLLAVVESSSVDPKEVFWKRVIMIVSTVICGAVFFLMYGPKLTGGSDAEAYSMLPLVNSILNATTACLLVWGVFEIKKGALLKHQRIMLSAFGTSALFLVSYVIYHLQVGHQKYGGDYRALYFFILITHIILAIAILPMALTTLYRGLTMDRARHRRLAKWTFPIWLYVSVTGVMIYVMAHVMAVPKV